WHRVPPDAATPGAGRFAVFGVCRRADQLKKATSMMTTALGSASSSTVPVTTFTSNDDASLVSRLKRGDQAAFEQIVRTHGGRPLSVARRFLGSNEDAEDAVQETFIKAFKAIRTFEERAQLHTWLHRIVVTTSLMKLRERRRKPQTAIAEM